MHSAKRLTAFGGLPKGLQTCFASSCSRRYRAGANGVRGAALRRPIGVWRLDRLNCFRMAVTLLRRDRVRGSPLRLSADRRKGGGLFYLELAIEALVGCSRGQARSRPEAPDRHDGEKCSWNVYELYTYACYNAISTYSYHYTFKENLL